MVVVGGGGFPHQVTWLALFALLMNYLLILAYHPIMCLFSTNSATMLMPSDVIYSWHHHALSNKNILKSWLLSNIYCKKFLICVPSSFVGKIYTYHRSEHSPGVRFCKYLLVHLLTCRHVCFSYFAFTFCLLPISITLSNILLWTVCLTGLSDRFEFKKVGPKTGYRVKEVHKKQ